MTITDIPTPDHAAGGGALTPVAIDALLRYAAHQRPQAPAVADPPNKPELGLGPAFAVTFGQADAIADRLAHNFERGGLGPGDVVAIQLPNTIEAILVMLGAWRAGLVVAPLPGLWRLAEIDQAFERIKPHAVVTMGRAGSHEHCDAMCRAAVDHLSVRFVFGFGPDLPDVVTPIDDWLDPSPVEAFPPLATDDGMVSRDALLTWPGGAAAAAPMLRSHAEVIALACAFVDELRLTSRDSMLSPFAPMTITAFGGLIVPWLLSGARLVLHLPFQLEVFLDQLAHDGITYTAVPAAVMASLEKNGSLVDARRLARIGCVWPSHTTGLSTPASDLPLPVYDIHNLAETGLLVCPRGIGADPTLLPLGSVRLTRGSANEAPYIETRLVAGEVALRGPTVPSQGLAPAPRHDGDGYLLTGLQGEAVGKHADRFRCQYSTESIQHGGLTIAASELDRLYAAHPDLLDAAAVPVDDEIMGERIVAAVVARPHVLPSLDSMRHYLTDRNVAPHKHPDAILAVHSIPRDEDGRIVRQRILPTRRDLR